MPSRLIQNSLDAQLPSIDRGEGVWLYDTDGRRYFDASSGAVVTSIGHADPSVIAALGAQAAKVTFTHRGAFTSEPLDALADRLGSLTGFPGVWFVNSGSEAVEAAMQFSLQYFRETGRPERNWFLSHSRGYHGNTLGGLSLSGHARRAVVGELAHLFPVLDTPDSFRGAQGASEAEYTARLLARAEVLLEQHRGRVAGIVVEPIGGATLGCNVPPDGYLQGLRQLADTFDVLLIVDEVMTGLGRTGTPLAVDHWGVRPDLVAVGKGLGAGYTPIAAVLVGDRVLRAIQDGSRRIVGGHTYGGNPLSAAVAMAVLDVFEREDLIGRARALAVPLEAGLRSLAARHDVIVDVRGRGALYAIELAAAAAAATDERAGARASRFATIAQEQGAIVYAATGGFNDAVIIAPPLTTSGAELDELFDILDRALERFETETRAS